MPASFHWCAGCWGEISSGDHICHWKRPGMTLNVRPAICRLDAHHPHSPGAGNSPATGRSPLSCRDGPAGSGGALRRNPFGDRRPARRQPQPADAGQRHQQCRPGAGRPAAHHPRRWQHREPACRQCGRHVHRERRGNPFGDRRPSRHQPQPADAGQWHQQCRPGAGRPAAHHPRQCCGGDPTQPTHGAVHGEKRRNPLGHRGPVRHQHRTADSNQRDP